MGLAPLSFRRVQFVPLQSIGAVIVNETRTDLDSHADTCVVSEETALVIHDFDKPVEVYGYDHKVGHNRAKTVSAVIAYDHPATGDTYYLILHQALLLPVPTNLLCPLQLRDIGIRVNDEPKHLAPNPNDSLHAITIPADQTTRMEPLVIPLTYHGVTSTFPTTAKMKVC